MSTTEEISESTQLKGAIEAAGIKLIKYDPTKQRPVSTSIGTMDLKKFSRVLLEKLGVKMAMHPVAIHAAHDLSKLDTLLAEMAEEEGSLVSDRREISIPQELSDLTLNMNMMATEYKDTFFVTTKDEYISQAVTGHMYIRKCNIPEQECYEMARAVVPDYRPRGPRGVVQEIEPTTKEKISIYNKYVPAHWERWRAENPKEWNKLPFAPPTLFIKLLKHLIPDGNERKYLYAWIYASLTKRSYVYLVLCGAPGAGKNRLKLVLRALHGNDNSNDGKKSTLTERFNSQLSQGTLTWFDELKYNEDMENVMKEIQNDHISIERKGVDATKSSMIHSSMVISNNKPRDNFIAFDARKFAPLMLASKDLRHSMTDKEIETLSRKVEVGKPGYDVRFVAQIAKWFLSIGSRHYLKYSNLEYRGPMFWTLAHTSMTRWQKKAIAAINDNMANPLTGGGVGWDPIEKGFLWSKVEAKINKKHGEHHNMTFPDPTSVRAFFDVFRDGAGNKAFDTKAVPGNILGDFWVIPLIGKVAVITETTVAQQREKGKLANGKTEKYDL